MNIDAQRRAIRSLLDERKMEDALASYYAFYHPEKKTNLMIHPPDARSAQGYIALSRTGLDLFRPLVTMRLPLDDHDAAAELVGKSLPFGAPALVYAPVAHGPLLHAFFDIQTENLLRVMILDRGRYQPVLNVLVTQEEIPNGLPRFVIRSPRDRDRVVASAGVNWQTPNFAEISVFTESDQRRQGWGRSVVAALCQHLMDRGHTPLYTVSEENGPSIRLAESAGFVDLGARRVFLQATRGNLND